jgi:hypothetical protein
VSGGIKIVNGALSPSFMLHPGPFDAERIMENGQDDATETTTSIPTSTTTTLISDAPLQEFYMFRAASEESVGGYPFGNINAANMDGVMWYLMNEVVTMYTNGTRCPRKFNITQIKRYKVQTKATRELFAEGMNFGVRFSYDQGKCMGRCFADNKCSSTGDCTQHFKKYGFFPGCNNFWDKYPFPNKDTAAPGGIWFSLPLEGLCDWPTGAHNCTWSYEDAGEIRLEALEATTPWGDPAQVNCCNGKCSGFWDELFDIGRTSWRTQQALDMFALKYPDLPRDLNHVACDFAWQKWYNEDPWEHLDPWAPKPAVRPARGGDDQGTVHVLQ